MKKIVIFSMLAISAYIAKAQDLKKAQSAIIFRQLENAKAEIDKLAADPKTQNKPETQLYMAKAYSLIARDKKLKDKYPNAFEITDLAYRKYLSLDKEQKFSKDNSAVPDSIPYLYSDAYRNNLNQAIVTYNAKKYDSSAIYFTNAVVYSDFMIENKWIDNKNFAFDTTALMYGANALKNAGKVKEAAQYYTRLIDAKIASPEYVDLYRNYLLLLTEAKDNANFKKYLAISKAQYPKENWEDYELNHENKSFSFEDKIAAYEKEHAAGTLTANKYLQYGDLFASIPKEEKAKYDSTQLAGFLQKAGEAFKNAFDKNPTDGLAAFNTGVIFYNVFNNYDDRYVANRRKLQELNNNRVVEKDPKKKVAADAKFKEQTEAVKKLNTDIEKPMMEACDMSIDYLEKAYTVLKDKPERNAAEKNCLNKSVDFLSNLFAIKRDKAKGKDPKMVDVYEAKYKTYDDLHGKFK